VLGEGKKPRTDSEADSRWQCATWSRIRAQEAAKGKERETFKQVKRSSLPLATSLDGTAFDKTWEVREEVASSA